MTLTYKGVKLSLAGPNGDQSYGNLCDAFDCYETKNLEHDGPYVFCPTHFMKLQQEPGTVAAAPPTCAPIDGISGIDYIVDRNFRSEAREAAYSTIDTERDYQNAQWRRSESNDPNGHNPHTVTEWLVYMRHYIDEGLRVQTTSRDANAGLDFARKVAALGVVCMEQHGAPRREGY